MKVLLVLIALIPLYFFRSSYLEPYDLEYVLDHYYHSQWEIPNSAISRIAGKTVVFVEPPKGFRAQTISVLNEGAQNSVIGGDFIGDEIIAVRGVSTLKSSMMGIGGGE